MFAAFGRGFSVRRDALPAEDSRDSLEFRSVPSFKWPKALHEICLSENSRAREQLRKLPRDQTDRREALGMQLMFTNDFNAILKTNRSEQ